MLVKAIEVGFLMTNCYVVTDENTMDAVIIDPGADSARILNYVSENHMNVRAILITHGHFDHTMGLEEVAEELEVPVYMSQKDLRCDIGNGDFILDPPDDTRLVLDGDEFDAGSLHITAIACPGHTPGGMTYKMEDCLFTGDTLFRMACGRYDFPSSSAFELADSLEKLRDLAGDYEVFPGHGSSTSLNMERRFNPYLMNPRACI